MDKVVIQIGEALLGRKLFEGYAEYKKNPIWDWGKGKMKGGFSESIDEASMYPSEGGIISVVTPPQTGSGGRFGNNGDSEGVGLVAGMKNTDGSSMYPGVGQVVSIGTPSQSGSVGRFGNEAKKLRDFALGKKVSKTRDNGYPGTAAAKTRVPPWESPSPGQAAGEPCDCDFHGMKDMPSK